MTPKDKAKQLADYYMPFCSNNYNDAKQCALIAVNEILDNFPNEFWDEYLIDNFKYWGEVKKEIEAL
jgi:hypothetical protein